MTNRASINANLTVHQEGSASGGTLAFDGSMNYAKELAAGIGADQFDIAYVAERTVADGANDDIDLAGVLTDAFGATITAAEVIAVMIINRKKNGQANTTNLTLGGGSNPITGFSTAVLKPGDMLLMSATTATGLFAVTGGSADNLRIANSAGAQNKYQIAILARSA